MKVVASGQRVILARTDTGPYAIVRHPRTEVVQEALQTIVTQVRVEAG